MIVTVFIIHHLKHVFNVLNNLLNTPITKNILIIYTIGLQK